MTVIFKNHRPVAYTQTRKEAETMVINKVFEKWPIRPTTWEHACKLSNCNAVYEFRTIY